jgi:hypothetical protein
MIKPNWNIFKAKFSENPQDNFEWFSYLLFCKEFNKPHGIFRYKNQSGIETDPIELDDGSIIGWQAKFYDDTLSNHKSDLLGTLQKSKRDYPGITHIILYTNSQWGQGRGQNDSQAKIDVEAEANDLGIDIEWRTASYFESPFVSIDHKIISSYFFSESPLIDLSPNKGWYPYENWANPSQGIEDEYILSDKTVIFNEKNEENPLLEGLNELREKLSKDKSAIRLVGLSGVGKTRFVQAIFDGRIGDNVPDASLVCYTDMSREPDPSPIVMAEQLVNIGERVILIVDNCPPDLHRELVKTVGKDESQISLLTVEYDVREDLPEETDVFKLEPNSQEVIEKIIKKRFEHISQIDARSIAEFSGGNARIAIALANTMQRGETLSGLRDEELFKRLFQQRNDSNEKLMQSAEVLSLVYSFNGQEIAEQSELAFLATLIDKTTNDLYRDVEELKKRELIQVRGDWKAVLPQAISNRLAKQALESLPHEYIVEKFINSESERLIKSFAHRLSFLHDSKIAISIVQKWLEDDGWLGKTNCDFNNFEMDIFQYIAPVVPDKVLACIERAAENRGEGFLDPEKNNNSNDFVDLLRHIAYDSELFDRAVNLICKFAVFEKRTGKYNTIEELLKTLFWMSLSGTLTSPTQRENIINELLKSEDDIEQAIGFSLLEASLETSFTSHHSFDFGARSRDFGWHPKTNKELSQWYQTFINICIHIVLSDHKLSKRTRTLLADNFRGLWNSAISFELLEEMSKTLHDKEPWIEGWVAIKEAIEFDHDRYSPKIEEIAIRIEEYLRPNSLYERAQVHILPGQHYSSDCYSLYDDKKEIEKCQESLNQEVFEIGKELAEDKKVFLSLLPKMVISDNYMLGTLVKGLISQYEDKNELWSLFYSQYADTPMNQWQLKDIEGILSYLATNDFEFVNTLMDSLVDDKLFAEIYPRLQMIHLDKNGIVRLHQAIDLNIAPLWQYQNLAYGRRHEVLDDDDLYGLLKHIWTKENGLNVVTEILSMRFHAKTKEEHSKELIDLGFSILLEYPYQEDDRQGSNDHKLEIIATTCFENNPDETVAASICKKISDSQGISFSTRFLATIKVLSKYFPKVFLTCCLENNFIVSKGIRSLSSSYSLKEANSIYDEIEDKYILEWCEQDPEPRYQFVASVINPLDMIDENLIIKPLVYSILNKVDNKIDILNSLISSRESWSFTSQRIETFDSKKVLFQELKDHDNVIIKQWAERELSAHLLEMETIHDLQKNESKAQFERFE